MSGILLLGATKLQLARSMHVVEVIRGHVPAVSGPLFRICTFVFMVPALHKEDMKWNGCPQLRVQPVDSITGLGWQ